MNDVEVNLRKHLNDLIRGYWSTQALYVAAELDIAGHLVDGPRTPDELGDLTGAQPDAIYRILRALASMSVFREDELGRFSLTPLAEALTSTGGRAYALLHGQELYQAWGRMLETARTGQPAFVLAHGAPLFDYLADHPDRGEVFDHAMTGHHGGETLPMLEAYDFAGFRQVVDVGGGNGSLLIETLRRHLQLRGVLFDLPPVVERAAGDILAAGLGERIQVSGGDFLKPDVVPPGADAYVLRHVVHDWNDADTVRILTNVRRAAGDYGRVLVVEMVVPAGNEPAFGKWLDLMMMAYGGKERTEKEYRELFGQAGLSLTRVVPTRAPVSIVEGVPVN